MLLIHSYWPEHSPPQRRWTTLIREFRKADWDVDVVAPVAHFPEGRRSLPREKAGSPFRGQMGPHGERIKRVPYIRHSGNFHAARLVDQVFSAAMSIPAGLMWRKADVVVVTAPSLPIMVAGYVVAKLRHVPLIVEMRDAWPDLARDARIVKGSVKSVVERVVEAIQLRADLVVSVTEGFAETLRARGVKNVVTISNGLDLDSVPVFEPPAQERDTFEALYLGNHGESQRLDVVVRASALVGDSMRLHMVGHGTQRPGLMDLAEELNAPVTFHESLHGQDVLNRYKKADTCIVSLRDDWKSFEATVPSKTYEVMSIGRHVTAIVRGEAARIVQEADGGDVVAWKPEAVAELWRTLAADRTRLQAGTSGRDWVREHANYPSLALKYMDTIGALVRSKSAV
ncbi:glycosyltransferase family 4 protein [Arthrobacter wenxiniae]|uniref:D-inositol 3-phosphate glycosyltransferase n=1 Tax=Arthrobacter wenxiniae TaxID=2713570 RepID=A0A7Y7IFI1_9MICC|nr:glycosyltransferase family 4 protein [Arthrobacter wenxiniae]NVM93931.1 glycosyltransferase family 4 protein [Arthrobacter wenxiniae]